MNIRQTVLTLILLSTGALGAGEPNIVIIVSDDQGYADISFNPQHPPEVSTPHLDALARESVFFTQAYISGNVCSPTRAGLMLGRYQQRVGVYTAGEGGSGFDPDEPIFPSFLPDTYVSSAIGKWHLGLDTDHPQLKWHALNRGFDECYKFMGRGAHDYFELKGASGADDTGPIYRNKERIDDEGYLTTRLTEEACSFIERHSGRPFFLYLAYNAVHFPKQAPREDIERFRKTFPEISEDRAILMAMLYHLDLGVGRVVAKLKEKGVWNDTLLFFLTDNGGARNMRADNAPLRGFKGGNYEGGIRTPFIISWPARFKGGRKVDAPVTSLDILPTALAATGVSPPKDKPLDGIDLLPLAQGKASPASRDLFWSSGGQRGDWAVRSGNWKLVGQKARVELFDLGKDVSEAHDLAKEMPVNVNELTKLHDDWLARMADPMKAGSKKWAPGDSAERSKRESREEKKRRREQRAKKKPTPRARADEPQGSEVRVDPPRRPNVLFIVADDLRCSLGCYGASDVKSPHIDRLATRGLLFERAYVQYPVCNPSRTSMLTGLRPDTTGILDNRTPLRRTHPDIITLPQLFRQNDYFTASIGKIFHSGLSRDGKRALFVDPKSWVVQKSFKATKTGLRGEGRNLTAGKLRWCSWLSAEGVDEDQADGQNAAEAVRLIEEHRADPFFIAVGFHKPHDPFNAPKKYFDLYPLDEIQLVREPADRSPDLPLAIPNIWNFTSFTDRERREFKRAYYAGTSFTDAQVGKLLDTLDRLDLWKNTIVLFMGDHGYHLGEHRWWNKVTVFELCSRTPLIVWAPGFAGMGKRTRGIVEFVDLFPTLADLCGLTLSLNLEGVSFRPLIADPSRSGKNAAHTQVRRGERMGRSVRTDRWRYTEWDEGRLGVELYGHPKDPVEYRNLAGRPEYADVEKRLKALLRESSR